MTAAPVTQTRLPDGFAVQVDRRVRVLGHGAALLGGLTLGWWRSLDELAALPMDVQPFEPRMDAGERGRLRCAWRLAVRRARLRHDVKEGSNS